jgi:hypothetical protein
MKEDEMGWICSGCGGEERCLRIVVGRPEGNGPFGEARCRQEHSVALFYARLL